jgi:D-glycero-alpha-D-manno-heptose 1-phosphate guanylyltransferase
LSEISAAILTGGLGTRLRTVVSDRPKALAQVGDRPFVCYLLDQLCKFPISQAVLCTGYMGKMIESCLGKSYRNLTLIYSQEPLALGTAGALRLALPFLKTAQVLVLNGDSFCDVDFGALMDSHKEWKASITIAVKSFSDTRRYGTVIRNDEGEIVFFKEKGEEKGAGLINAGIYVLDYGVIKIIPPDTQLSLERDVFPLYLGQSLHGFMTDGFFIDIGIPGDYARAKEILPNILNNSTETTLGV